MYFDRSSEAYASDLWVVAAASFWRGGGGEKCLQQAPGFRKKNVQWILSLPARGCKLEPYLEEEEWCGGLDFCYQMKDVSRVWGLTGVSWSGRVCIQGVWDFAEEIYRKRTGPFFIHLTFLRRMLRRELGTFPCPKLYWEVTTSLRAHPEPVTCPNCNARPWR